MSEYAKASDTGPKAYSLGSKILDALHVSLYGCRAVPILYLRTTRHSSWCRRNNNVFRMVQPFGDRDSWYLSAVVNRAVFSGIWYCPYHILSWLDVKAENEGAIVMRGLTCSHHSPKRNHGPGKAI